MANPLRAGGMIGIFGLSQGSGWAEKKLIPGLESGPILIAPCSFEGVVDRDA
jgi:hypothetical protein